MSDDIFRYTPEIDQKVPQAVEEAVHTKVLSIQKLTHGEVNHVYKVETENGPVIIRIFRMKYWPGVIRVKHIEELLTQVPEGYPHTLFLTDTDEFFPNGFMISEYVEGVNGHEAIEKAQISFEAFHKLHLKNLKKIYSVPVFGFGHLNPMQDTYDDFLSFRIDQLNDRFSDMKESPEFDEVYRVQIEDIFKDLIAPINQKIKPVLVHGDPTPLNTIYTPDRKIVILDWDNASSNSFMRDFAYLTYWGSHLTSIGPKENRNEILWRLLLEEFSDMGFSEEELKILERVNHIGISLDLLPYYRLTQQNMEAYELIKKRLTELVEG
jgi:Ser/Thr protein kinase RdoA (MazF antagonist)